MSFYSVGKFVAALSVAWKSGAGKEQKAWRKRRSLDVAQAGLSVMRKAGCLAWSKRRCLGVVRKVRAGRNRKHGAKGGA